MFLYNLDLFTNTGVLSFFFCLFVANYQPPTLTACLNYVGQNHFAHQIVTSMFYCYMRYSIFLSFYLRFYIVIILLILDTAQHLVRNTSSFMVRAFTGHLRNYEDQGVVMPRGGPSKLGMFLYM